MRIALVGALVALAACSSRSSPPGPGSAEPPPAPTKAAAAKPAIPRPTMKSSAPIDLTAAEVTKLQLLPIVAMDQHGSAAAEQGVFDLRWISKRKLDAGIVCRIESYNLAYFGTQDLNESAGADEHEVMYRPDPFVLDPKTCEVRLVENHTLAARACYQDGTMTEGACPAGTFPPPKVPTGMAIGVEGASAHKNGKAIQIKAMFTVAEPLKDAASFALVCDGIASVPDKGEGFVPLSKLAAGETLYTWELAPIMKQELPGDPKHCQLTITGKQTLGTFCIADGSTDPGRCGT